MGTQGQRLILAACLCGAAFLQREAPAASTPGLGARDMEAAVQPVPVGVLSGLSADDQAALRRMAEYARGLSFTSAPPFELIAASNAMFHATNGVPAETQRASEEQQRRSVVLGIWMGVLPEDVEIKTINRTLMESEVAGFYSTDTKRIFVNREAITNDERKAALGIVLAHELIHALDDQHGYIDTNDYEESDALLTRECMVEGSATLGMLDALPPLVVREMQGQRQAGNGSDNRLFLLLHSMISSSLFKAVASQASQSLSDLESTNGVPDVVMRELVEPYVSGFLFCQSVCAQWGLDGLDRVLRKPPRTMHQVLHPGTYWAWRDWPEGIDIPTNGLVNLPGWSCIIRDALGESDTAIYFDCLLGDRKGRAATKGWNGDEVVLFGNDAGRRMMVWASAWDSRWAARRFESAYRRILEQRFKAKFGRSAGSLAWSGNTRRSGRIVRDGTHVIILESDEPDALRQADRIAAAVRFAPPPEEARRAAQNHRLLQYNPLVAWQRDDDWQTWRAAMGLYRCDRCEIGAHHSLLGGWLLETRRSRNFSDDSLLAGWLYRRIAEARREAVRLRLLPAGLAVNYSRSACPSAQDQWFSHGSLVWGLLGSWEDAHTGRARVTVLPFGWLCGMEAFKQDGKVVRRDLDLLPWGVLWHDSRGTGASARRHDNALAGLLWSHRSDAKSRHTTLLPWGVLYRMDGGQDGVTARVLGVPVYRRNES